MVDFSLVTYLAGARHGYFRAIRGCNGRGRDICIVSLKTHSIGERRDIKLQHKCHPNLLTVREITLQFIVDLTHQPDMNNQVLVEPKVRFQRFSGHGNICEGNMVKRQ